MPITMDFFELGNPINPIDNPPWNSGDSGLGASIHFKGGMLVSGSVILTESSSPGRWKRRWRRSQFWAWWLLGEKASSRIMNHGFFLLFVFLENKSFTGDFFWRKIWVGGCFCWMVKASQVLIWMILFVIFVIGFAHVISVHVFFWLCNRGKRVGSVDPNDFPVWVCGKLHGLQLGGSSIRTCK